MKSVLQDFEFVTGPPADVAVLAQDLRGKAGEASAQLTCRKSVPELFAEAVEAFPAGAAAEFQGTVVSRREIAGQSDRLAAWLIEHDAGPGCLVGIYMDRSIEMLIAILGVMKAGAAYVPLDPDFPRARNQQILSETEAPVLLTLRHLLGRLPESDAQSLCLDGGLSERDIERVAVRSLPEVSPEMRAYVMFTSGSTGQPKGVEVTHGSVVNLLTSAMELLEAGPVERLVAITTLAFDISVLELLLPLVCGGTVVIASKEEASDAMRLKELLKSSRATMLQATPVTFRSLLELGFEAPSGFKMMCGGEAWAATMAEKLLTSGARMWNMYGPTETTIWSSIAELERGAKRVTFGPPIAATRFYVMDAEMKLVPAGHAGELCISGAGVARGYLHRPELTAERFLADPFVSGERMYRTGDEVRQLEDGTIEFIGRLDQQVKLRGFRIELGEIEAGMLRVAGVKNAVAVLRKDAHGEGVLAGFYVGAKSVTETDLRQEIGRRSPAYMMPKVFARLEALPLTPNGKTDRKALAEMTLPSSYGLEKAEQIEATSFQPDESLEAIEGRMLGIWQRLFPDAAIEDSSSFFDLGGDSLLLVRLQSRIQNEFALRLTMADVTQNYTYAALVDWVRNSRSSGESREDRETLNAALLPLQTNGAGAPIFVIPQMLIFRTLAEELGQTQPFYAVQLPDEDVADELASASFEKLAELYYRQIRQVQPTGPYRLAGWCLWGWMAYAIASRMEADGAEVEMLAIIDAWAPGYWKRYSPVRQFFVNAGHFWQRIMWYAESMQNIPVRERFADGFRRLREMSMMILRALPRGLRPELDVVETLRIQRFAAKAAESYRPGPVEGNVVVFKSELRPTGSFAGEDMGWSAILGRKARLDALPGNHNEIFSLPAARIMAARMRDALGQPAMSPNTSQGKE